MTGSTWRPAHLVVTAEDWETETRLARWWERRRIPQGRGWSFAVRPRSGDGATGTGTTSSGGPEVT